MKKFKANKIRWVENIVNYHSKDKEQYYLLEANKLPSGKWICEIVIPVVGKTVSTISKSEVSSMLRTADKAYKEIKAYSSNHPEFKIIPISAERHWEIESDDNGDFVSMHLNSDYRSKLGLMMQKDMLEAEKAVEKAVNKIKKINGTDKNLFIQVIDKSVFKTDDTIENIQETIHKKMFGDKKGKLPLDCSILWQVGSIRENCAIVVGYIMGGINK